MRFRKFAAAFLTLLSSQALAYIPTNSASTPAHKLTRFDPGAWAAPGLTAFMRGLSSIAGTCRSGQRSWVPTPMIQTQGSCNPERRRRPWQTAAFYFGGLLVACLPTSCSRLPQLRLQPGRACVIR